jgi:DNA-binding Lrp family transcriptional regulator
MSMNRLDREILWHLDANSRVSLTDIAKLTGVSSQVIAYRIKKLLSTGTLKGCIATIDISRLGLLAFRFYARINNAGRDKESDIIRSLTTHRQTLWVVSTSGHWDIESVFVARNFVHFNQMLKEWKAIWGKTLSRINISMSPVSYRFRRDYLIDRKRGQVASTHFGFEPLHSDIDELDQKILGQIASNCRRSNDEIGRHVDVSYHTVCSRIDSLKHQEILQGFTVLLDLHNLNRRYIKALLWLEQFNEDEEKEFISFCSRYNFVLFINEVLGDWQWEIEAEVEDYDTMYKLLKALRQAFPKHVTNYELLEVTREHKHAYAPHLITLNRNKKLKTRR